MGRRKIRLLILPKFDIGELGNGRIGEGELFYNEYVRGGEKFEIRGVCDGERLYVRDGVALALTHAGKVNAAAAVMGILNDQRIDCDDMQVLSVGCAGSNYERTVMGDVVLGTGFVDYDLGHHVLNSNGELVWFADEGICGYGCVRPNQRRIGEIYERIKDTPLATTEKTVGLMRSVCGGVAEGADVMPSVRMGTMMTSDNYWKGEEFHRIAKEINEYYGCEGEYMVSEMEEVAVARVLRMVGKEEDLISLRVSVNLDCYMGGATAERLWSGKSFEDNMMEEDNMEGGDIFETAMRNLFAVGRRIIDGLL